MKCQKCGYVENVESATVCVECGSEFPLHKTPSKKPLGVTIYAIALTVVPLFGFVFQIVARPSPTINIGAAIIPALILTFLFILLSVKLLKGRNWARITVSVLLPFLFLTPLVLTFTTKRPGLRELMLSLIPLALAGVTVWYFTRPAVRTFFHSSSTQAPVADVSTSAGFWKRLWSFLIDYLIFVPLGGAAYVGSEYLYFLGHAPNILIQFAWFNLLVLICLLIYKPLMETLYGATLGKKAVGILVVDRNGQHISVLQAYLRFLPFILFIVFELSILLPIILSPTSIPEPKWWWYLRDAARLFIVVDSIFILFAKKKRAIHDVLAHSFCVHKQGKL